LRAENVYPAAATVFASRISASALSTNSTSSWTWVCQFMKAWAVERPARNSSTSCRMLARDASKGGKKSSSENQRARSSSAAASEKRWCGTHAWCGQLPPRNGQRSMISARPPMARR
jgi:hypothetical protein